MVRLRRSLIFSALFGIALASPGYCGDEDAREAKKKTEEKLPQDTAMPKEPEAPELSVGGGGEEPSPHFETNEETELPNQAPKTRRAKTRGLDENVDYARIVDSVETADPGSGVLPPAQGFRGYRPSMIAVGVGDRVPGFGGMMEFSWNRIGVGAFASYRSTHGEDPVTAAYGLAGIYGLYRWLPFDFSPYFLMGGEAGSQTDEPLGGVLGLGIEARVYYGWTFLFGWTFHSTVHRGFLGGAIGWSF